MSEEIKIVPVVSKEEYESFRILFPEFIFPVTFEEWVGRVRAPYDSFIARGVSIHETEIKVSRFVEWCHAYNRPVTLEAFTELAEEIYRSSSYRTKMTDGD